MQIIKLKISHLKRQGIQPDFSLALYLLDTCILLYQILEHFESVE